MGQNHPFFSLEFFFYYSKYLQTQWVNAPVYMTGMPTVAEWEHVRMCDSFKPEKGGEEEQEDSF